MKLKECTLVGYVLGTWSLDYRILSYKTSISVQWWELLNLPIFTWSTTRVSGSYGTTIYRLSLTPYPVSCVGISDYHAVSVFSAALRYRLRVLLESFSHPVRFRNPVVFFNSSRSLGFIQIATTNNKISKIIATIFQTKNPWFCSKFQISKAFCHFLNSTIY